MENAESDSGRQPARLRRTPSWLITQTATLTHRLVSAALAEEGATRYQYAVLAALDEYGSTSQAELGRRCRIDRSDIVATVNDLVADAFVERRRDPGDRRQNLITLTAAGRRRMERIAAVLAAVQDDLVGVLSDAERTAFVAALQRILDARAGGDTGD